MIHMSLTEGIVIQGFQLSGQFLTLITLLAGLAWRLNKYFYSLNGQISSLTKAIEALTQSSQILQASDTSQNLRIQAIEDRVKYLESSLSNRDNDRPKKGLW